MSPGRGAGNTDRLVVRLLAAADLKWAEALLGSGIAGRLQARRGELMDTLEGGAGSGVVAELDGRPVGLLTWQVDAGETGEAEVRALAVAEDVQGRGIGRALLAAAEDALRAAGVRRAWLVTTNDNLAALALYQKAGWRLRALHVGAVDVARIALKPSIPEVGDHGITLRDELELERLL